jgi:hypothetical protein
VVVVVSGGRCEWWSVRVVVGASEWWSVRVVVRVSGWNVKRNKSRRNVHGTSPLDATNTWDITGDVPSILILPESMFSSRFRYSKD